MSVNEKVVCCRKKNLEIILMLSLVAWKTDYWWITQNRAIARIQKKKKITRKTQTRAFPRIWRKTTQGKSINMGIS
jgi:hypothetical protein